MTTAEATTVNALIRERMADLNGSFPKREVAELVYGDLTDEQIRAVCLTGIMERIRNVTTQMRPPVVLNGKSAPSTRWDAVRESREWWEEFWVFAGHEVGTKHLFDCTPEECDFAAEDHQYRADTAQERANEYRELAKRLRKAKAATVADLDRDEVRRIFNA